MATNRFDGKQFVSDLERAWGNKDSEAVISKYYDANVEFSDPAGKMQRGTDALRKVIDTYFEAFSEMKVTATQIIQTGNEVAILQHCKGRNSGEFEMAPGERIPATNKTIEIDVAEFLRVNDQGKIVRDVTILDSGQMMTQLGLLPGPGQAATGRPVQR